MGRISEKSLRTTAEAREWIGLRLSPITKDRYRKALERLADLRTKRPQAFATLAGEFKHLAKGYRAVAGEKELDEDLATLLTELEQSTPQSRALLMWPDKYFRRVSLPSGQPGRARNENQ